MPPRIKNISNYRNSQLAGPGSQTDGYDTAFLLNHHGKVSEGPGACVMMVSSGTLITPDVGSGILESITRDALIVLAREVLGHRGRRARSRPHRALPGRRGLHLRHGRRDHPDHQRRQVPGRQRRDWADHPRPGSRLRRCAARPGFAVHPLADRGASRRASAALGLGLEKPSPPAATLTPSPSPCRRERGELQRRRAPEFGVTTPELARVSSSLRRHEPLSRLDGRGVGVRVFVEVRSLARSNHLLPSAPKPRNSRPGPGASRLRPSKLLVTVVSLLDQPVDALALDAGQRGGDGRGQDGADRVWSHEIVPLRFGNDFIHDLQAEEFAER